MANSVSYTVDGADAAPVGELRALRYGVGISYGAAARVAFTLAWSALRTESEGAVGNSSAPRETVSDTGDLRLGIDYDWLAETAARPEVTVSPRVKIASGDPAGGRSAAASSGFDSFGVTINLAKSFDAITLFGDLGLADRLPEAVATGEQDPGLRINYGFGTAFTVNRRITLTQSVSLSHDTADTLDGREIANSRSDRARFTFGAIWALTRNWYVRHDVTLGLKDTPDAAIGLGLVYRRTGR